MADSTKNIIYVLNVLEKYSSKQHRLKQEQIVELIQQDYDVSLNRKAVAHCIQCLEELFSADSSRRKIIRDGRKGVYLIRAFEDGALKVLIDSARTSRHIPPDETQHIVSALKSLGTPDFQKSHAAPIYKGKKSKQLKIFEMLDKLEEYAKRDIQIEIDYSTYNVDKNLVDTKWHKVSPYRVVLHSGNYYLICFDEGHKTFASYRVDKIKDVEELKDPKTPIESIGDAYYHTEKNFDLLAILPFMATDELVAVDFYIPHDDKSVNQVVDWFGDGVVFSDLGTHYSVRLKSSLFAMEQWASLYLDMVTITGPPALVDRMKSRIDNAQQRYNKQ